MKNKALALRALAKDCGLRGAYVHRKATCAIGCLALLAGVDRAYLKKRNWEPVKMLGVVVESIHKKFGLSLDDQKRIQETNDAHKTPELRREAVLRLVRRFR